MEAERSLREDFGRWAAGAWETEAVRSRRAGWLGLFSVRFLEELKNNKPLESVFQATMLAEIPGRVVDELVRRGVVRAPGGVAQRRAGSG